MKYLLIVFLVALSLLPTYTFAQYGAVDTVSPPPSAGGGFGGTPQKYEWCRMTLVRCMSVSEVQSQYAELFKDDEYLAKGECPEKFLFYKSKADCEASFAYEPFDWAVPQSEDENGSPALGACTMLQNFDIFDFVSEKYGTFETETQCKASYGGGKQVWCLKNTEGGENECSLLKTGEVCGGKEYDSYDACFISTPDKWCESQGGGCINRFASTKQFCKTEQYFGTEEKCKANLSTTADDSASSGIKSLYNNNDTTFDATVLNKLGTTDLKVYAGRIIKGVMGILGSLTLVMFVYSGILFMTDRGSGESIGKAKDIAVWTSLGLAVIFASYAILSFVFQIFGK